jgi:hypothetical protein
MKIGNLYCTPEGLEALAKSARIIGAKSLRLEVHQDDDSHGVLHVCCELNSGWINLEKGFYDK